MAKKITIEAITELKENGEMTAIASDESIDRVGDSLKVTDWDFKEFLKNPVLQAGHDYKPQYNIGIAKDLRVEGKKVKFTPVFHDITRLSREIHEMFSKKFLRAWSVGLIPGKEEGDKNELLEVSAVAVPANSNALTTVKSLTQEAEKYDEETLGEVKSWIERKSAEELGKKIVNTLKENIKEVEDEMDIKPFPNEHSCRLRNPDSMKQNSFKSGSRTSSGKKLRVITAELKGEDTRVEQAFRYPKDVWTENSAKSHCNSHDGILFEPASEKQSQEEIDAENAITINTGVTNNHSHAAFLDIVKGTGETAEINNHIHQINNFKIQPGGDDDHIHSLKIPEKSKGTIPFRDTGKAATTEKWSEEKEFKSAQLNDLIVMSSWFDLEAPDKKESYKLLHHRAEGTHLAVFDGVKKAMNDLLTNKIEIPASDRKAVHTHLARHYKQFDEVAPEFKELEKKEPKKGIIYKKRWNPQLSKAFDIERLESRPANFEYLIYTKFLNCKIKNVFLNSYVIPSPLMGTYLAGFKQLLGKFELADTRNFAWSGGEMPPVYEVVKLNSKKSDDFLIHGMNFYKHEDKNALIVSFTPEWYGIVVTMINNSNKREVNKNLLNDVHKWVKENNYLKGEKFGISGEFLPKSEKVWDDVILDKDIKSPIVKAVKALNDKKEKSRSRGLLFLGEPGTGKTQAGKVIMNQAESTFIWVSSKDFEANQYRMNSMLGLSFKMARDLAPTVLFIEDIDSWLKGSAIDTLKIEMDGIKENKGLVTILTTNFPEQLPKALIDRPGRFHDVLDFALPTDSVRKEMLIKWTDKIETKMLDDIVEKTKGYSGAYIRELVDYAEMVAEDEGVSIDKALLISLEKIKKQRELVEEISKRNKPDEDEKDEEAEKCDNCKGIKLKEGRIISTKNRKSIKETVIKMEDCTKSLGGLLELSEHVSQNDKSIIALKDVPLKLKGDGEAKSRITSREQYIRRVVTKQLYNDITEKVLKSLVTRTNRQLLLLNSSRKNKKI